MVFTSVSGHITNKEFPPQYKKWDLDTIIDLYDAEITTFHMNKCEAIIRTIKAEAAQARMLIIWTDCDREGENIGFEIIEEALSVNRNLVIKRAVFSALTTSDIERAMMNLQEPNKNLSDAVEVRKSIDLIIGSSFTRMQTLLFREKFFPNLIFEDKKKKILSYGPCLFPTLYFIVLRAEQRRQFKKEQFWYLQVEVEKKLSENDKIMFNLSNENQNNNKKNDEEYDEDQDLIDIMEDNDDNNNKVNKKGKIGKKINKKQNNKKNEFNSNNNNNNYQNNKINNNNNDNSDCFKTIFNWEKNNPEKITNYQVIRDKYLSINDETFAKIIHSDKRAKPKYRPFPLNTVEFTKLATRKLRINSHKAMEIAEKLYTKGFISYPRTETEIFADNFNFKNFLAEQTKSEQWGDFVEKLIDQKNEANSNFWARKGKHDDKSHPPIYPVKFSGEIHSLNHEEKQVYELIARHFIATVCDDAILEETTIKLKIKNEIFAKTGTIVRKFGYLEVYKYETWSDNVLPDFQLDEMIPLARRNDQNFEKRYFLYVEMGTTSPPELLREADLIGLMDENGIGTDATIAEHIKNVQDK